MFLWLLSEAAALRCMIFKSTGLMGDVTAAGFRAMDRCAGRFCVKFGSAWKLSPELFSLWVMLVTLSESTLSGLLGEGA